MNTPNTPNTINDLIKAIFLTFSGMIIAYYLNKYYNQKKQDNNTNNGSNITKLKDIKYFNELEKYCYNDILPFNQLNLSSCTANAISAVHYIMQLANNVNEKDIKILSRMDIWYRGRVIIESPAFSDLSTEQKESLPDEGAYVLDGLSYLKKYGVCEERNWPYSEEKHEHIKKINKKSIFDYNYEPENYKSFEKIKIKSYRTILVNENSVDTIKEKLISKIPVLINMRVHEGFENLNFFNSIINMPISYDTSEETYHEMCIVGFNNEKKLFTVLNSWGTLFGYYGLCYLPYDYITLCNNFYNHLTADLHYFTI